MWLHVQDTATNTFPRNVVPLLVQAAKDSMRSMPIEGWKVRKQDY